MISDEAIAAAAQIGEHHAGVFQNGGCPDHFHEDSFECVARLMLEAAIPRILEDAADAARAEGLTTAAEVIYDLRARAKELRTP